MSTDEHPNDNTTPAPVIDPAPARPAPHHRGGGALAQLVEGEYFAAENKLRGIMDIFVANGGTLRPLATVGAYAPTTGSDTRATAIAFASVKLLYAALCRLAAATPGDTTEYLGALAQAEVALARFEGLH